MENLSAAIVADSSVIPKEGKRKNRGLPVSVSTSAVSWRQSPVPQ